MKHKQLGKKKLEITPHSYQQMLGSMYIFPHILPCSGYPYGITLNRCLQIDHASLQGLSLLHRLPWTATCSLCWTWTFLQAKKASSWVWWPYSNGVPSDI